MPRVCASVILAGTWGQPFLPLRSRVPPALEGCAACTCSFPQPPRVTAVTASEGVTALYAVQDEIGALRRGPKPLGPAPSLARSPPRSCHGEPVSVSWAGVCFGQPCFLSCLLPAYGRGARVKLMGQRVCPIAHTRGANSPCLTTATKDCC